MLGHKPNGYWKITWKYLSPLVLTVMGVLWISDRYFILNQQFPHNYKGGYYSLQTLSRTYNTATYYILAGLNRGLINLIGAPVSAG